MRFGFLTPELFDILILANLALGILLILGRFIIDMRRKAPVQRQQTYDESSYSHLSDTDANPALQDSDITNSQAGVQND